VSIKNYAGKLAGAWDCQTAAFVLKVIHSAGVQFLDNGGLQVGKHPILDLAVSARTVD
jgi:hypothetical protein